jgi:hypothetical protein
MVIPVQLLICFTMFAKQRARAKAAAQQQEGAEEWWLLPKNKRARLPAILKILHSLQALRW